MKVAYASKRSGSEMVFATISDAHLFIHLLHKTFSKSLTQTAPAITTTDVRDQNRDPTT